MKLSTMLFPEARHRLRCAMQQTALPNDSRETASAPSARHAFLCRPHPPVSGERCRSSPTADSAFSRRTLRCCTVSRDARAPLTFRSGIFDLVVNRQASPRAAPTRATHPNSLGAASGVFGRGSRISLDGRWPQGRGCGPRMAQKSERWRVTEARRDSGFAAISAECTFVVSRLFFLLTLRCAGPRPRAARAARPDLPSCPGSHRSQPRGPGRA